LLSGAFIHTPSTKSAILKLIQGGDEIKSIKAIIFDSGNTLNKPVSGNWFIPLNFFELVDTSQLILDSVEFKEAMHIAYKFLMDNHCVKTEEEEFLQFREFYSILFTKCNYTYNDDLITALARDNVYNDQKFMFFDDVESTIKELHNKFKLGIISDTWPSLERVFINKGFREYFTSFVMSSVYGVCKNNKRLFEIAIKELDIKPFEALFIDDSDRNLDVAKEVGLIPIKIDRNKEYYPQSNHAVIKTLTDLFKYL
jgi:putative hydrolase of the HAD superfamily